MIYLKACPRKGCGGDMTHDSGTDDLMCLQCGHYLYEKDK